MSSVDRPGIGAPGMTVPQTIIVTYPESSGPSKRQHFKERAATILGSILVCCGVLAVITQVVGFVLFHQESLHYSDQTAVIKAYGEGINSMAGVWTAPFMFLSGSFALVSAKTKRTGFIVTTLVLSILSAIFAAPVFGMAVWVVVDESNFIKNQYYHHRYYATGKSEVMRLIKAINAAGVFLMLFGLTELVCSILLSTLCCAAVCCTKKSRERPGPEVMYLSPSGAGGGQMVAFPNPSLRMTRSEMDQATGGELPPSYSTTELNKAGLDSTEGNLYPAKQPIPD